MNAMFNVEKYDFNGTAVRCMTVEGKPWFVAIDVATILGYSKTSKEIQRICKKRTTVEELNKSGKLVRGTKLVPLQKTVVLMPEADVYRLIMRSNMPEAVRFQDWVVEDLLPTLREKGSYEIKARRIDGKRKESLPGFHSLRGEWSKRNLRSDDYRFLTYQEYQAMGLPCDVRKKDMDESQLLELIFFEAAESIKLKNDETISDKNGLCDSLYETGEMLRKLKRRKKLTIAGGSHARLDTSL